MIKEDVRDTWGTKFKELINTKYASETNYDLKANQGTTEKIYRREVKTTLALMKKNRAVAGRTKCFLIKAWVLIGEIGIGWLAKLFNNLGKKNAQRMKKEQCGPV